MVALSLTPHCERTGYASNPMQYDIDILFQELLSPDISLPTLLSHSLFIHVNVIVLRHTVCTVTYTHVCNVLLWAYNASSNTIGIS